MVRHVYLDSPFLLKLPIVPLIPVVFRADHHIQPHFAGPKADLLEFSLGPEASLVSLRHHLPLR